MLGIRRVVPVAIAACAAAFAVVPVAAAAVPQCGDTVTRSVVLGADLLDCPVHGLVIGADGVTIDLNGHVIDGNGTHDRTDDGADTGVLSAGYDHVTIANGTIRDFDYDADVEQANAARVLGVTFTDSGLSLVVGDSTGTRVTGNHVYPRDAGMVLVASDHSVVTRNVVDGASFSGIGDFEGDSNQIERNIVTGSGDGEIVVAAQTARDRVNHNRISDGHRAAIALDGAFETVVVDNRIARHDDGITVAGDDNRIEHNSVSDIVGCGEDGCGIGISGEGGSRNLFAHNAVARTLAFGLRLDAYAGETTDNVFRANRVSDAGTDGFGIGVDNVAPIERTTLERNKAFSSGDDGFDVRSASTTLTGNLALRNGDLGFDVVAGVIDGGGNHAVLNGNPLQCTTIACSSP